MELYDLPQGWVWTTFDDVFSVVPVSNSKVAQRDYLGEGILPIIDQGQMFIGGYTNDIEKQVIVEPPVIIFGDHTTVVKYVNFNFVTGADGVKVLKPSELFISKFLYYCLQIAEIPNRGYGRHFQYVRQLQFPLPPLPEQERIVEAIEAQLSRIEAGVASVRNAQRALRRYKASVLNAACTGQLLPQDPTDEPAALLLERILAERRKRWESEQREKYAAQGKPLPKGWQDKYPAPAAPDTTDLPELPEGWVWASLEVLAKIVSGFAFKSSDFKNEGVPVVKIANVSYGTFVWKDQEFLPREFLEQFEGFQVKKQDILFALTRPITNDTIKCCLYPSDAPVGLVNQRVAAIQPILLDKMYLYLILQSAHTKQLIKKNTSETLQPNLSPNSLSQFPFPVPPLAEQVRIVAEVERRLSVVAALEQTVTATLQRAARLRQSVLRKAFRGELVAQDPTDEPAEALLAPP